MAANKNDIVSQLSGCSRSDDLYLGPGHLSPSSRKSWTRQQEERKREMQKEKSDAALARIFDDPSFPFVSIGSTNASSAGAACAKHSSGVFRHEAPVNLRVFLHVFLYTILQSAPNKFTSIYLWVYRSCVTHVYYLTWIVCSCYASEWFG